MALAKSGNAKITSETEIIHPFTKELTQVTIIQKSTPKNYDFREICLQDILCILNGFSKKKIKILTYLLNKMHNEDYSVTITQVKISKDTGISRPTVSKTIKELLASNVLKKDQEISNLYRFNPSLIINNPMNRRCALITLYNYIDMDGDNESINQ